MSKILLDFSHPDFGTLGIVFKNGKPYFRLSDVCRILGYRSVRKPLPGIMDNGAVSIFFQESRFVRYVGESGLKTLLLCSHPPRARPFRSWLAKHVMGRLRSRFAYVSTVCF